MAFGISATAWLAIGAGTAYAANQMKTQEEALNRQNAAQQQAKQQAEKVAADADMAFNRANQKKPNVQSIMDSNKAAGMGGAGSTMLTGPLGIDPTLLTLGRNTLLGS